MTNTKEAAARIVIAEFEARRLKERSEERARRWRVAFVLIRIVLVLGFGVYVQVAHQQISGAQACGLLSIFIGLAAWEEHQLREKVRVLEAEVDRLKNESEKKTAESGSRE